MAQTGNKLTHKVKYTDVAGEHKLHTRTLGQRPQHSNMQADCLLEAMVHFTSDFGSLAFVHPHKN